MDVVLRKVVENDLGVRERALQRALATRLVVTSAVKDAPAGHSRDTHFELVKLATRRGRSMKAEDIDNVLRTQHLFQIGIDVIGVLEDLAAGRLGEQMEGVVRVDVRAVLVVLHAHALDIDGMKHDVRSTEGAGHLFEERHAHRATVAGVGIDAPDVA